MSILNNYKSLKQRVVQWARHKRLQYHARRLQTQLESTSPKIAKLAPAIVQYVTDSYIDDYTRTATKLTLAYKMLTQLEPLTYMVSVQPINAPDSFVYNLAYAKDPEDGHLSLRVDKHVATAVTRKFTAQYSIEAMQDALSVHLSKELVDSFVHAIACVLADEIFAEVIGLIRDKASSTTLSLPSDASDEMLAKLILIAVSKAGAQIAHDTRRGVPTVLITSAYTAALLKSVGMISDEVVYPAGPLTSVVQYVYTLSPNMRVYVDATSTTNDIIVGYVGASYVDAGIVYAPHQLVNQAQSVDTETFQPVMTFDTRRHLQVLPSVYGNGMCYYHVLHIPQLESPSDTDEE